MNQTYRCSNVDTATAPSKRKKNKMTTMVIKHSSGNGSCRGKKKRKINKETMAMATNMATANDHLAINQLLLLDTAAATYPSNISCYKCDVANPCSDAATATAPSKK